MAFLPPGGLQERCLKHHREQFNEEGEFFGYAPGRVNLIGEHTDYNNGFVLPMTLSDMGTCVVGKKSDDKNYYMSSDTLSTAPTTFLTASEEISKSHWTRYVIGAIKCFQELSGIKVGVRLSIASNVPLGAGLSSSAALEVAVFSMLEQMYGTSIGSIDKVKACKKAENVYAGVPCGIMDQFICTLGGEGKALFINCETNAFEEVPLADESLCIVVTDTHKKHDLAAGEYADRKATCEAVAASLGVGSLAEVSMDQLEAHFAQPREGLPPKAFARARHVVGEIDRAKRAVVALREGDMAEFGRLMNESHRSLAVDYEVSCAELDAVVAAAQGSEGVLGSRMTGGGFGGCAISLVRRERAENLMKELAEECPFSTSFSTTPGPGATSWRKQ